jgi:phosphatidylserine/phosphatidylglycerophosphate/cardiolipin synthase-like enzyme
MLRRIRRPRANRIRDDNGRTGLLHAKCAVADGKRLFLSSANLTECAFTLNMELGVLVAHPDLAAQVERHFEQLISCGVLVKV